MTIIKSMFSCWPLFVTEAVFTFFGIACDRVVIWCAVSAFVGCSALFGCYWLFICYWLVGCYWLFICFLLMLQLINLFLEFIYLLLLRMIVSYVSV